MLFTGEGIILVIISCSFENSINLCIDRVTVMRIVRTERLWFSRFPQSSTLSSHGNHCLFRVRISFEVLLMNMIVKPISGGLRGIDCFTSLYRRYLIRYMLPSPYPDFRKNPSEEDVYILIDIFKRLVGIISQSRL